LQHDTITEASWGVKIVSLAKAAGWLDKDAVDGDISDAGAAGG